MLNKNSGNKITLHEDEIKKRSILSALLRQLTTSVPQAELNHPSVFFNSSSQLFPLLLIAPNTYDTIIDIAPLNSIIGINKRFFAVNGKLPNNGLYVCCYKPYHNIKKDIFKKYPFGINYFYYLCFFIYHRLLSKLALTSHLYFCITRDRERVLSFAEVLGRLYYSGFKLKATCTVKDTQYIAVIRDHPPFSDKITKYYGPIIKLPRVCFKRKICNIYKLRTMYPYSEYIQSVVFKHNKMNISDKSDGDFRISTLGHWMRRHFIDEIPMLINVIKGDIKLVGVRPLSEQMFKQYPKYLRDKRIRCKPGLLPPFYINHPHTLQEVYSSENQYLDAYFAHPLKTDIKYFFLIVYAIFFKGVRSN